jgi:transposase-like protein
MVIPPEKELTQLRRDKARLEEEVEILKKASGIFLSLSRKDIR